MSEINKTILIIEDDDIIRENLEELLSEKYRVIVASGGRTGLEILQKELPDLVLCDVNMAGITGYNVLTEMRANPKTATIPFIFLTALDTKDNWRLGMELGADDYLTKPFTRKYLLDAISARLKRFESKLNTRG